MTPFPSLYTFGDDTAEAVYNIKVSSADGYASLQRGTPTYSLLTNDFNASLSSLISQAKPSSSLASPTLLLGAAAVVVVIVAIALVARRRQPRTAIAQAQVQTSAGPPGKFCRYSRGPHRTRRGLLRELRAGDGIAACL